MILVPFIPFMLIMGLSFYSHQTSLESGTIERMERIVDDHRHMIDAFLEERTRDLEFIIDAYTFTELSDQETLKRVFNRLKKVSTAFEDLGVFDAAGMHVSYQGPHQLVGRSYRDAEWFMEVIRSGIYISDVFMGYRQQPHFIIAMASAEGPRRWVIRTTIDTKTFERLVGGIYIGDSGEAYIVNTAGVLQTNRRSGGGLLSKTTDNVDYAMPEKRVVSMVRIDRSGENYLYAMARLKGGDWTLAARQKATEAFAMLYKTLYRAAFIFFVGGLAIVFVAFYMTDRIARRLEAMHSEKENLTRQLIGTSRLAEIGEMAAGFAHEINNPLQIIKSEQTLIETLFDEMKADGRLKSSGTLTELEDSFSQINLQISRCAKITQAILKFGRQSEPEVSDIDLHRFIPEVTKMIQQKASVHGIAFDQRIQPQAMIVRGDPAQLQQVILNLLNNAMDAILESHGVSGGELRVKALTADNGWVKLQVSDNGCGISSANIKKVFSPFFTTKPTGEGTGLGLSVCYGIVESMGGSMEVVSREGVGTTFTVRLKAASDPLGPQAQRV
jgi:two-component system NtrC family sensor kinase